MSIDVTCVYGGLGAHSLYKSLENFSPLIEQAMKEPRPLITSSLKEIEEEAYPSPGVDSSPPMSMRHYQYSPSTTLSIIIRVQCRFQGPLKNEGSSPWKNRTIFCTLGICGQAQPSQGRRRSCRTVKGFFPFCTCCPIAAPPDDLLLYSFFGGGYRPRLECFSNCIFSISGRKKWGGLQKVHRIVDMQYGGSTTSSSCTFQQRTRKKNEMFPPFFFLFLFSILWKADPSVQLSPPDTTNKKPTTPVCSWVLSLSLFYLYLDGKDNFPALPRPRSWSKLTTSKGQLIVFQPLFFLQKREGQNRRRRRRVESSLLPFVCRR